MKITKRAASVCVAAIGSILVAVTFQNCSNSTFETGPLTEASTQSGVIKYPSTLGATGTALPTSPGSALSNSVMGMPARACNVDVLRANLQNSWNQGERPVRSAALVDYTYCLLYGRNPDMNGRGYWRVHTSQMSSISTEGLIAYVIASDEFKANTANLSNAGYMDYLYRNVFQRPADTAGVNYWVNQLNTGASTRKGIVENFVVAPNDSFRQGLALVADTDLEVAYIYTRLLGRTAAVNYADEGVGYFSAYRQHARSGGGITSMQMALYFSDQPEFDRLFLGSSVSLTGEQMVRLAYNFFLQREGEAEGSAYWLAELRSRAGTKSSYTRSDFVNFLAPHFVASTEFATGNPWYQNQQTRFDF